MYSNIEEGQNILPAFSALLTYLCESSPDSSLKYELVTTRLFKMLFHCPLQASAWAAGSSSPLWMRSGQIPLTPPPLPPKRQTPDILPWWKIRQTTWNGIPAKNILTMFDSIFFPSCPQPREQRGLLLSGHPAGSQLLPGKRPHRNNRFCAFMAKRAAKAGRANYRWDETCVPGQTLDRSLWMHFNIFFCFFCVWIGVAALYLLKHSLVCMCCFFFSFTHIICIVLLSVSLWRKKKICTVSLCTC